jgi:hypothetical protein
MSFLDEKIFGLIRTVSDDTDTRTARQNLKFTGSVTVTDDPAGNTVTVDVSGGGGGGGTPSNATPVGIALTGAAGSATAYSRGDHTHALTAATVQTLTAGAATDWNFNNRELAGVGIPTAPGSAARKFDVDALAISSLSHPPARAIGAAGNVVLSGIPALGLSDGVTLVPGDRFAPVTQSNPAENGPWIVSAGAWSRPADWANGRILDGDFFFIKEGTQYGNQGLNVITNGNPVAGMDSVAFDLFTQQQVLMEGDVTGYNWGTRIEVIRGDITNKLAQVRADAVSFRDLNGATNNKVYREEYITSSTTPVPAALTHNFTWTNGSLTAVLQVDMMNAAGVVESFWIRETRKFGGGVPAVLIGTAKTNLEPASPTGAVSFVWGISDVTVSITAPSASTARWAINLQVFEVESP